MDNPHNFDFNWGGSSYEAYSSSMNSTPAITSQTTDGGSSPAGGEGAAANPASPAADSKGASSTPATGEGNDANLKVLRESHTKLQEWTKLGDLNQVQQTVQTFTKLHSEGQSIAQRLGYEEADFKDAFSKDPIKTLQILRAEAAQAAKQGNNDGTGRNIQDLVKREVEQFTKPITEQMNIQATEKANTLFVNETNRLIDAEYTGDKALPPDTRSLLFDMTSEILKYDADSLVALKKEGKTAGIQKAYAEAKDIMTKAFSAWQQAQSKSLGNNNAGANNNGGAAAPKLNLDDIINGTDKATKVMSTFK